MHGHGQVKFASKEDPRPAGPREVTHISLNACLFARRKLWVRAQHSRVVVAAAAAAAAAVAGGDIAVADWVVDLLVHDIRHSELGVVGLLALAR